MKNIGIFASGGKMPGEGGSGTREILNHVLAREIEVAKILIVSNNQNGGVSELIGKYQTRLNAIGVSLNFFYLSDSPSRENNNGFNTQQQETIRKIYQKIFIENNLDFVFLSGWLKQVLGLIEKHTINIHPGPIQEPYGGLNLYGQKVHEKVWEDYQAGKIKRTCVTMHFVNDELDRGQVICQIPVELEGCKSTKDVKERVNAKEHEWQWQITRLVIRGEIHLDESGKIHYPDEFPEEYQGEIDLAA